MMCHIQHLQSTKHIMYTVYGLQDKLIVWVSAVEFHTVGYSTQASGKVMFIVIMGSFNLRQTAAASS